VVADGPVGKAGQEVTDDLVADARGGVDRYGQQRIA
jgi:hypothetical protein